MDKNKYNSFIFYLYNHDDNLITLEQVPSGARIPLASAISWCIKNIKSMKYRSLWLTFSLRSNSGHIHSFISNFNVALKVQINITGSWNVCQRDILLLWG